METREKVREINNGELQRLIIRAEGLKQIKDIAETPDLDDATKLLRIRDAIKLRDELTGDY